jgi:hypothetical protein
MPEQMEIDDSVSTYPEYFIDPNGNGDLVVAIYSVESARNRLIDNLNSDNAGEGDLARWRSAIHKYTQMLENGETTFVSPHDYFYDVVDNCNKLSRYECIGPREEVVVGCRIMTWQEFRSITANDGDFNIDFGDFNIDFDTFPEFYQYCLQQRIERDRPILFTLRQTREAEDSN